MILCYISIRLYMILHYIIYYLIYILYGILYYKFNMSLCCSLNVLSSKLNCFHKADSFEITGSEASTPGPKTLHGYVPVTPISASSYDALPEATEEERKSSLHKRRYECKEMIKQEIVYYIT